jgi:hypothetical protein
MLPVALGVAVLLLAAVAVLIYVAGQSRARALADEVRLHVEPLLRRKAAEVELPADAPTWTARSSPEEIVIFSSRLAARLLERERHPEAEAEDPMVFANTSPDLGTDRLALANTDLGDASHKKG